VTGGDGRAVRSERHPVARLGGTLARMPRYVRLARALLRDPHLSKARKAAIAAGVAYLLSPVDLIPGFIPVAGQLDDLAVALYGLRTGLRGLPPGAAARHLASVGLSPTALDADIDNVRSGAGWTAGVVAATTRNVIGGSARAIGTTAGLIGGAIARRRKAHGKRRG
jgi:uncharacterized membrane protein YkvA (DUF1232 family)